MWLYSPVCVGPGRKPRRPVLSQRGSIYVSLKKGFRSKRQEEFGFIDNVCFISSDCHNRIISFEPRREKTCPRCFRPGPTQTQEMARGLKFPMYEVEGL